MIDKQELKRQYLEADTRAGVYAIRNLITGRTLIAGSNNAQGSLNRHRFELRFGSQRNLMLMNDWILHGEDSFVFEILDMVKPSKDPAFDIAQELETLVELWQQEFLCKGAQGYNQPMKGS